MKRKDVMILIGVCILLVIVVIGMEWMKAADSISPKSLVTTFKSDPKTSRAFTWYSDQTEAKAVVQLLKESNDLDWNSANVITFTGTTTSLPIENGLTKAVHKAEASGLEAGIAYTYRVGNGKNNGWSEAARFQTEADNVDAFTFINVADSQGVTEMDFTLWGNTLDKAFETFPEAKFIVHNGDLTEDPQDEQAWTYLFEKARKWVTSVPLMPVTGNHDEVDGEAARFVSHFNVPTNGAEDSIEGTTYSFDYGSVHFVMLNSESNVKKQTEWLRNDLENTDKPWKIVSVHQGPYGGNTYKKLKDWVKLFDEFGVDVVLQGHNHEYSRSYPLKDGEIVGDGESPVMNKAGTVYVVTNTSGQKFNEKKDDRYYHKVHFQNQKQMFAGISVKGDRLTYMAYDVSGTKLDEFVLQH